MNKKILFSMAAVATLALVCCGFIGNRQPAPDGPQIQWTTMEEAARLAKDDRKKILIDVYTDWCGWCKRMEASTYQDPEVVKYINEHYHAVKFDAEQRESLVINGKTYTWREGGRNGFNEFAYYIMNGEMAYPTTVFSYPGLDTLIAAVPGYIEGKDMNTYLRYFDEEAFKTMGIDAYKTKKK